MNEVEDDSRLIGEYIKLRKKFRDMINKMESIVGYHGKIYKYVNENKSISYDLAVFPLDHIHSSVMKLNPDQLEKLVQELRELRKEYEKTYNEYKIFLNTHQKIPEKAGINP